jgi:hypothetical protein
MANNRVLDAFPFDLEHEHIAEDPLQVQNENAGQAWLSGYVDAWHARDQNPPSAYVEEYLRGFIAGMKATKGA